MQMIWFLVKLMQISNLIYENLIDEFILPFNHLIMHNYCLNLLFNLWCSTHYKIWWTVNFTQQIPTVNNVNALLDSLLNSVDTTSASHFKTKRVFLFINRSILFVTLSLFCVFYQKVSDGSVSNIIPNFIHIEIRRLVISFKYYIWIVILLD